MAHVLLITNPAAARADPAVVREVSTVLGREGWDVDVVGTTRPGHAGELAAEGVAGGVDVVAVYGGDGTTMQAVSGMVGHEVALGLIPGGTGNLLAGNLRLPRSPREAARVIAHGRRRRIDLGRVERTDGPHYFAVACGAGFDAQIMAGTSAEAKRRWKIGAYVAQAWDSLDDLRNVTHRIMVDDQVIEAEAATVLVANCGEMIPPFVKLGRGIRPDDGLLDVILLRAENLLESVNVMWRLVRRSAGDDGSIRYARGARVVVETTPARPMQMDGEATGETPFTADLVPGGLTVLVAAER